MGSGRCSATENKPRMSEPISGSEQSIVYPLVRATLFPLFSLILRRRQLAARTPEKYLIPSHGQHRPFPPEPFFRTIFSSKILCPCGRLSVKIPPHFPLALGATNHFG